MRMGKTTTKMDLDPDIKAALLRGDIKEAHIKVDGIKVMTCRNKNGIVSCNFDTKEGAKAMKKVEKMFDKLED